VARKVLAECRARMEQNGYEAMEERLDPWCLKTAVDEIR
jgi:5,10-methenyltetrahydromethanopterin hydrogenase